MRRWCAFGAMVAGAAVVLGACGGSTTDDGGASSVSLEELPAEFAAAACGVIDGCFAGGYELFSGGQDCVETLGREVEDGELGLVERAVAAGDVVYDAGAAADCLRAVAGSGCSLFVTRLVDLCPDVLVGSRDTGADCTISAQCRGAAFCKSDAACPGACTPLLAAGQTCEDDGQCASGLLCSPDTMKCVVPAAEGGACEGGTEPPCPPHFACQGGDETTVGTCRSIRDALSKAEGSACDFLATDLCQVGLSCAVMSFTGDVPTMECMAPASSGGACRLAIPEHCPPGEYCAVEPNTLEGTCRMEPTNGQPCGVQLQDQGATVCASDHACVSGTCQALQRLGGACQVDETCYSGVCAGTGCAPTRCADAE